MSERRERDARGRCAMTGIAGRPGASRTARTVCILLALLPPGCASIGPATVSRDRMDYISAVADSWKEQTLLNIVRMRYGDAPSFVDVSSIISAYALQGQLSAAGQISSDLTGTIPSNLVTLGGGVTYLDRPTITYTPLAGRNSRQACCGRFRPAPSSN